jgi:hypothetical protein
MKIIITKLSTIFLILQLTACSIPGWVPLIGDSDQDQDTHLAPRGSIAPQAIDGSAPQAEQQVAPMEVAADSVELTWEIPKQPVDAYLFRYGTAPDRLDREERVPVARLTKVDDPKFGYVYRHVLEQKEGESPISYVSIAAIAGSVASEVSSPVKVD